MKVDDKTQYRDKEMEHKAVKKWGSMKNVQLINKTEKLKQY